MSVHTKPRTIRNRELVKAKRRLEKRFAEISKTSNAEQFANEEDALLVRIKLIQALLGEC